MPIRTRTLRVCRVDRLLTAALLVAAFLSLAQDGRAQTPPLPIYKMQSLDTLPGQPNSDRGFVTQVSKVAPSPPPQSPTVPPSRSIPRPPRVPPP